MFRSIILCSKFDFNARVGGLRGARCGTKYLLFVGIFTRYIYYVTGYFYIRSRREYVNFLVINQILKLILALLCKSPHRLLPFTFHHDNQTSSFLVR
jgi:hypothetical protein